MKRIFESETGWRGGIGCPIGQKGVRFERNSNWKPIFQLESQFPIGIGIGLGIGWIGKKAIGLDWQLVGLTKNFFPIVPPWLGAGSTY